MTSNRVTELDDLRDTFGAQKVAPDQRRAEVNALFDRVATRYDLMNDLMSFGLHRLWKRQTVTRILTALTGRQGPLVDLAAGTGDIALAVKRQRPELPVILADASQGMLAVARSRGGGGFDYVHAEAEDLPMADNSAAAVSLAFGLRNMTEPARALAEVQRILQPGGRLLLLEFSRPAPWFAPFYALHARYVIPALGMLVARDKKAYTYLVESISRFPESADVTRALEAAGLKVTTTRRFMFGVAVLHEAQKR